MTSGGRGHPDRKHRRILLAATLVLVAASCTTLLPERFAIHGPVTNSLFGWGPGAPGADVFARRVRVPPGFGVSIFADGLPNARMLRFTPAGDLLVSQPRSGRIAILAPDRDGDGRSDEARVLVEGLNAPHGMDLRDGWLYVAEGDAIARLRFDAASGAVAGKPERIVTGLPEGGNHWTRTVRFGPDGAMYVTVGSSCNVCVEEDPRRAAMLRFDPEGGRAEVYATGLRNAVDFDWQPGTNALYATDNGRDLLGDDFPPCELNRVERGASYGWPFANGDRVPDPDYGEGRSDEIARSVPPAHGFGAHTAPLGMTFLREPSWPRDYVGAALVALHGSWNRTRLSGYRVVSLHPRGDGTFDERDFLWGLEENENVIGRPVAVAEGPDGAAYVSDDYAGVVYRIAPGEASRLEPRTAAAASASREPLDPAAVARGRTLWNGGQCASCHETESAREGMVVRELGGLAAKYSVDALAAFLAAPTPPMPAVDADEAGRRDLASFLLATWP